MLLIASGIALVVSGIGGRLKLFWLLPMSAALIGFVYYAFVFLPNVPSLTPGDYRVGMSLGILTYIPALLVFVNAMVVGYKEK